MRRRPTKRAGVVAGVGLMLVFVGVTAQAGWLFVLAAAVLSAVAASLFAGRGVGRLEVGRVAPPHATVGDDVVVELELCNRGRAGLFLVRIEDRFAALAPVTVVYEDVPAGERVTASARTTANRRGRFDSGRLVASTGWPFGFFRSVRELDVESTFVVLPRSVELRSFPLLEPSSYPAEALHERARIGAGLDYLGVREYRPGDPLRLVHWRSTARRGRLVVREYGEEALSRVAILLAGAETGDPPDSSFEALVTAAASIALYALATGHPVDLYRASSGGIEQVRAPDRRELLEWLATAEPCDEPLRGLVDAAAPRVGRRGTMVLLSPSRGRTASGLVDAVRAAQAFGARAVAVVARSSSWAAMGRAGLEDGLLDQLGDRTHVRALARGEDLRLCLEG